MPPSSKCVYTRHSYAGSSCLPSGSQHPVGPTSTRSSTIEFECVCAPLWNELWYFWNKWRHRVHICVVIACRLKRQSEFSFWLFFLLKQNEGAMRMTSTNDSNQLLFIYAISRYTCNDIDGDDAVAGIKLCSKMNSLIIIIIISVISEFVSSLALAYVRWFKSRTEITNRFRAWIEIVLRKKGEHRLVLYWLQCSVRWRGEIHGDQRNYCTVFESKRITVNTNQNHYATPLWCDWKRHISCARFFLPLRNAFEQLQFYPSGLCRDIAVEWNYFPALEWNCNRELDSPRRQKITFSLWRANWLESIESDSTAVVFHWDKRNDNVILKTNFRRFSLFWLQTRKDGSRTTALGQIIANRISTVAGFGIM